MKREFKKLQKYLGLKRGNQSRLAEMLGYATNATVSQWVMKETIPEYQLPRVMKIIERELRKAS